ncbi:MAG: hypothetical protein HRF49_11740 [bacterium]
MFGELTLIAVAVSSIAYFAFIQSYIEDPDKPLKDADWLREWEEYNRKKRKVGGLMQFEIDRILRPGRLER